MQQSILNDNYFMNEALKEAAHAAKNNEVPVGAVVVCDNIIIARAYNLTETLHDVTAHAEILAYSSASAYLGAKYLTQCTMYVTLEPCCMCAGALFWAQLLRLVYGADDVKRGYSISVNNNLKPASNITKGVMKNDCEVLLKNFFLNKR